jgi:hypothetical protein
LALDKVLWLPDDRRSACYYNRVAIIVPGLNRMEVPLHDRGGAGSW